jgi:hypothetical protein
MNFFPDAMARLKFELHVSKDGEVAAVLGLSKTAFAERKRRGSFPEKELYALAEKRPELHLDIDYVLTGIPSSSHARLAVNQAAMERALEHGADPGTAWKESDKLERLVQRAKESDAVSFSEIVKIWPHLTKESRDALITIATGLVGGQVGKNQK